MILSKILRRRFSDKFFKGGEFIPREGATPDYHRGTTTHNETYKEMNKIFGEDYESPNQKWDLHVPIVDINDNVKNTYERHHEMEDYEDSKKYLRFIQYIGVFCVSAYYFRWR